MLLHSKQTGSLIEVLDLEALISPVKDAVPGRDQAGQEEQDPEQFDKKDLIFPSGENLPQCWLNPNYRTA
jgi:hypothetical protein